MRISDWSSDVCSSDLRYLGQQVEPFVNVGEEEAQGILDRLKSQEGQPEYHLKEIFLGATPDRLDEVARNAQGLMDEIKNGQQPFEYFTHYSEASTKRSEEHTYELQSLMRNSYAVFCLKK